RALDEQDDRPSTGWAPRIPQATSPAGRQLELTSGLAEPHATWPNWRPRLNRGTYMNIIAQIIPVLLGVSGSEFPPDLMIDDVYVATYNLLVWIVSAAD